MIEPARSWYARSIIDIGAWSSAMTGSAMAVIVQTCASVSPPTRRRGADDPHLRGDRERGHAPAHAELAVDVVQVRRHRALGHAEPPRDLARGEPLPRCEQHALLALRQHRRC